MSMLKNLILLSVDLKRFNFNFFREEPTKINEKLLKAITFDFPTGLDAINGLRDILKLRETELSDMDKLAIYLFNRVYNSTGIMNSDKFYLEELAECQDKNILMSYLGKGSLSKKDREKIKSFSTLAELFTYFQNEN